MTQLIVGAGATGLVAALQLAARGEHPRIVEKRDGPSPLSRAVGILPMSMPILERLGVADAIRSEAIPIRAGRLYDGARFVAHVPLDLLDGGHFRLFCLPQDRTEALLAERLSDLGVEVEYGKAFETLSQRDDRVSVEVAGEVAEYDHVLGADGSRSAVREEVGLEAEGYDLPSRWSIADIDVDRDTAGEFQIMLLADGNGIFAIPIGMRRLRVVATLPDALAHVPIELGVRNVRRAGNFAIGIRQVPRYRVGRVFLAGDAAHTHSPVGGRGMNLGMADGADWALRLVENRLDGYDAARHEAGADMIAFTERARRMVMTPDTFIRRSILRSFAVAVRLPPVVRRINRQILLPGYDAARSAST